MQTLDLQVTYSFCVSGLRLDPGWTLYTLARDLYINPQHLPAKRTSTKEHDEEHYQALYAACYKTLRFTPYLEDRECTLRMTDRLLIIRFAPVSTGFQNDTPTATRHHSSVSSL